ncbi:MAG TPA: DUF1684 domain-containing protein [Candidatus Sulfomarinibacteraceae bacterium]|nr:DUF1684 domain-containing protein [Candidatus Sulfomarinibacteraceae bacterium]
MSQLSRFRAEVDDFMEFHPQSPLTDEQRETFQGLHYYEEKPEYALEVAVERFDEDEPLIEMQTSTGDTKRYRRWGRFTVEVEDKEASLIIYSDPHAGDFFLPFKDASNGRETYGAGRYLDSHRPGLEPRDDDRFLVDFNYAYNPYCAYNEHYSCPLPPAENWLKVPIRAGEKKFE